MLPTTLHHEELYNIFSSYRSFVMSLQDFQFINFPIKYLKILKNEEKWENGILLGPGWLAI